MKTASLMTTPTRGVPAGFSMNWNGTRTPSRPRGSRACPTEQNVDV